MWSAPAILVLVDEPPKDHLRALQGLQAAVRERLLITADQLVVHLIGDYLLQSDWMATEKVKNSLAAWCHALVYSIPFACFSPSVLAWTVICATHFVIDRYRLARYVVWLKNQMGPGRPWSECSATGYPPEKPVWMAVWLTIIADNVCHVLLNGLALKYL